MSTRRTFIGGLLAAATGFFVKTPQKKNLIQSGFGRNESEPVMVNLLEKYGDGRYKGQLLTPGVTKFGHWDVHIHGWGSSPRGQYRRILVDGGEVACVEADDIEGWAIIDIEGPLAGHRYGIVHGQARVWGDVQILPGASRGNTDTFSDDLAHQMRLLSKPSSQWRARECSVLGHSRWVDFNRNANGEVVVNWDARFDHPEEFIGRDLSNVRLSA